MDRAQKHAFVTDLNNRLAQAKLVVVAQYRGCSVAQMETLRNAMRDEGGEVQVAKNRLAKIAFQGTSFGEAVHPYLTGPTALTFSADEVAAAKVAQKFADDVKAFEIVGGAMGEKTLSAADVKALSTMPSLDELRSKLIGLIEAPATKVARVTAEPAGKLARVIAMKEQAV